MLEDLRATMERLGIRYRKELRASPQVVAALTAISAPKRLPPGQPDLSWLTEIEVHEKPDMEPGSWVLVSHSGCEVIHSKDAEPRVSHARCGVVAFGTLTPKEDDHGN